MPIGGCRSAIVIQNGVMFLLLGFEMLLIDMMFQLYGLCCFLPQVFLPAPCVAVLIHLTLVQTYQSIEFFHQRPVVRPPPVPNVLRTQGWRPCSSLASSSDWAAYSSCRAAFSRVSSERICLTTPSVAEFSLEADVTTVSASSVTCRTVVAIIAIQ
jgi:hypothetical protein